MPDEVAEVFGEDLPAGWRLLYVFEDAGGDRKQWAWNSPRPTPVTPMRIPGGTDTILLLCEPEHYRAAEEVIAGLFFVADEGMDAAPVHVHVMLLRGARVGPIESNAALEAQVALERAGAADVFLKPSLNELELAISMSVVRAAAKSSMKEERMRHEDELNQRIRRLQRSVWHLAHTSLPAFPGCNSRAHVTLGLGSKWVNASSAS
jgi:hypothetical protein